MIFLLKNYDNLKYFPFQSKDMENSVDPDQLASEKPADLDLHCYQNRIKDTSL